MKGSALVATLVLIMGAAPVCAQQQPPAGQPRPAQPAKQPPPQPPAPFPAGAKIAFFTPQAVFQQSAEGKAALTRVNALTQKKQTENAHRQKKLAADHQELQQEVQNEFVKKLSPIIDKLANEKGLYLVFNAGEAGLAWAAPGLDLTPDVIKALDAAAKPAAAPKQ